MRVRSILSAKGSSVATVDADATLLEVAAILAEHGVGALVVRPGRSTTDGRRTTDARRDAGGTEAATADAIAGIVSERDLARALAARGEAALTTRCHEVMATEVLTCHPHDLVQHLMGVMTEARVRHLPVVEEGRLVGIVSIGDVVKHCVDELQAESRALAEYLYTGR